MSKSVRLFVIVLALSLLAVAIPAAAQDETVPRFEATECQFDAPEGTTFECGFVVVPEFHDEPEGDTIRLSVVILRGAEDAPGDPVMLLSGGPGEKTTQNAPLLTTSAFARIAGDRDLILFDQRGVGLSEPALECPNWVDLQFELLEQEPDPDAELQANYDALIACRAALVDSGIDLSAYNTLENAADVRDIVQALGYEQVNLVGVSYGSLLAQSVIRDYPEVIRSVVIDSVLPTTRSFFIDTGTTVYESLDRLLAACEADEACSAAYPDLQQTLFDVIDELNANPVPLTITDPTTGAAYDTYLTGDDVLGNLSFFLYQTPVLPLLPQAIYNVSQGDYTLMAQLSGAFLPAYNALTRGMQFSVQCAEDLIGRSLEEVIEVLNRLPPQYRGQSDPEVALETFPYGVCVDWGVPTLDPSVKEPVVSDVSALVLGGEYDPVTPFIYAEEVAENLSSSFLFEIPSTGHSTLVANECARQIAVEFIDDPTTEPNASCLADVPPVEFALPPSNEAGELVEFTSEDFGFSGVIPAGWQEFAPGVFAESAVSTTALIQQSMPGTVADAEALLQAQLGLESLEVASTLEANSLVWNLYEAEVQNFALDLALGADEDTVYIILLQAPAAEHEAAHEAIFLPVVQALTPSE